MKIKEYRFIIKIDYKTKKMKNKELIIIYLLKQEM